MNPNLAEIEKRAKAASDLQDGSAPWVVHLVGSSVAVRMPLPGGGCEVIAESLAKHNAEFIAAARTDVPALVSRCRALEAALKDALVVVARHTSLGCATRQEREAAAHCRAVLAGEDPPAETCGTCGDPPLDVGCPDCGGSGRKGT